MGVGPSLPEKTDILIVGAGVIGTATAYRLAVQTDREVTIVDRENIAAGATGDTSGILRHVYGDRAMYSWMAWRGHEFYRNFEDHTGVPLNTPDQPLVAWMREGEDTADHRSGTEETMAELGYPLSRLEADELPEEFPLFDFDSAITHALSDDTAGYADGTDAANGFARAARDHGATLVTNTAVESLIEEDGQIAGVVADGRRVEAEDVILAAGSWSYKLAQSVDVDLPITPGREQVLLLDPPPSISDEEFESIPTTGYRSERDDGVWWYFRADFGDTVYMATHARNDPVDPDDYDRSPDDQRKLEALEILESFVPKLADAAILGEYCGVYANTPDEGFIIDQVGPDGLYALVGAGHAFKHAPVIGELARDLVLDGSSDIVDLDHFSVARFDDRTPHQPLEEPDMSDLHLSISGGGPGPPSTAE